MFEIVNLFQSNSQSNMKIFISLFILIALVLTPYSSFAQKYTVLSGGTVIKTESEGVIENAIVLIKDSVIIAVGDKIKKHIPDEAEVIDCSGKYIIPGLADGHIHFFQDGGLYTRPDGFDLRHRVSYEQNQQWIKEHLEDFFQRYIKCGITSVYDMGGPYWNFEVRERARHSAIAPRTYLTGPLIASYQPEALTTDDPPIIEVKNKQEALNLVRKQAELKADFIKVWYVVSKDASMSPEEFYPILQSICKESHELGLKVWVHALELETAKKSIQAGADVLVHNVRDKKVDDEFLKMAKENNIILIPTMWVFNSYAAVYSKQLKLFPVEHLLGNPEIIGTLLDMYELSYDELGERQRKLQVEMKPIAPKPALLYNLKTIHDYGITVAAGTDAGNVGVIHGPSLFHEFNYMRRAGLTPREILTDATLNAAKLLDNQEKFGSIEKNKLADLVVLNENPLEDIQNTTKIHLVMKNGVIFNPDSILPYKPVDLVQIQLNAYNTRDIESFLSVYDEKIEVYSFPDSLLYTGINEMRKRYTPFFEKASKLHCKLVNRITYGEYVMDREFVTTGIPDRDNLTAVAIYEVKNGKIKKIWFMK